MRTRPAVTALVLALVVAGAFWSLRDSLLLRRLELTLLDLRYLASPTIQVSPRVAIIEFDTRSEEALGRHSMFWLGLWGQLSAKLLDNGASVVGLDLLLTHLPDIEGLTQFANGVVPHQGKVIVVAALDEGQLVLPDPAVIASVGLENVALADLTRDIDGVVRAQSVHPMELSALERDSFPFLASLAFERAGGKLPAEAGLNEFAGQNPFPTYKLENVVKMDAASLRSVFGDKIVLIGGTARSAQDLAETPFSWQLAEDGRRHSMPSLYVQAFTLNSLLTGRFIRPVPPWVDFLAIFLANYVVALAALRRRTWRAVLALLAVGLGMCLLGLELFFYGQWLTLSGVLLSLPWSLLAGYAVRVRWAERDRLDLQRSISRFVAPEVLAEMLADPDACRSQLNEQREVTVLCSDIQDFSTVCQSESPEGVARLLDEHYQEMSAVIFRHRGTIVRFLGSRFLVLFGAPGPVQGNPAEQAMRCALAMVARLEELAERGRAGFYGVNVGIHTGEMLLATLGDARQSEYTAVGDRVEQGARIQALCQQVGVPILASQTTVEDAGPVRGIVAEPRGELSGEGDQEVVRVYAIRPEGA